MRCPEHIEDLLPDYHLGQLTVHEAAEVRQALRRSPECRKRLAEVASVLDRLPLLNPLEDPPPGLKDRVLARATSGAPKAAEPGGGAREPDRPPAPRPRRGWRTVLPYAGGVAAALTILAFGLSYLDLREENRLLRGEVRGLETALSEAEREPAPQPQAAPEGGELLAVAVEGTARAAEGRGTAVVAPDSGDLALDVYGLPKAPGGHAYHAWLVGTDGTVRHLGEMELEGGDGRMTARAPDPLSTYSAVEVTTEPVDGTGEKTGPVYLRADI